MSRSRQVNSAARPLCHERGAAWLVSLVNHCSKFRLLMIAHRCVATSATSGSSHAEDSKQREVNAPRPLLPGRQELDYRFHPTAPDKGLPSRVVGSRVLAAKWVSECARDNLRRLPGT